MTPYRDVTDDEWQRVATLLPELKPRAELRGRPLANTRAVLNGVLWVMYSGATWSAMPRKYPSYQTCHRRFKAWHQSGVMQRVMIELYGESSRTLFTTMVLRMRSGSAMQDASDDVAVSVQGLPAAQLAEVQARVAEVVATNPPRGPETHPHHERDAAGSFSRVDVLKRAA